MLGMVWLSRDVKQMNHHVFFPPFKKKNKSIFKAEGNYLKYIKKTRVYPLGIWRVLK